MQIYVSNEREQKLRDYCETKNIAISKVVGELIDGIAYQGEVGELYKVKVPKDHPVFKKKLFVKERGEMKGEDYL